MLPKKNIIVGLDVRSLKLAGGVKTYIERLLEYYSKEQGFSFKLFGIKEYGDFGCFDSKVGIDSFWRLFYENFTIPKLLKRNEISIFHGMKLVCPYFGRFKRIITVHDIIPIVCPESVKFKDFVYWNYIFPLYLKKVDLIICISEATKKDLIDRFKVESKKIQIIYQGFAPKLFYRVEVSKSYANVEKYLLNEGFEIKDLSKKKILLNVNVLSPRKNIDSLIKAFNGVAQKHNDIYLFIVGKEGWSCEKIFREYESSPYKERIFFLGFVPEDVLLNLYNIAEFFIYPSLYEGFGLPILEAQACGCPVITSRVSSLPEVGGKSVQYFNPKNVQNMMRVILDALENKKERERLIVDGFKNIKRFSWEKCAKKTLKTYVEVCYEK